MIGRRRVVITGIGVLAANGIGKDAFWNSLLEGRSGVGPVTLFDASDIPYAIAGEVSDFNPDDFIGAKHKPKRMARFTQLAVAAAKLAIDDAHLGDIVSKTLIPISLGVSTSATEVIEDQVLRIDKKGVHHASPLTAIASLPQAGASNIASILGIRTQAITISTGCPAGLDAIAHASEYIRSGKCELALAGGSDAPITKLTIATFSASHMISTSQLHPERASRPFDLERDGGVIAEGSCIMVLENLEHALARGATPLLEITGYGCSGDDPGDPPGAGLYNSMQLAVDNAGLSLQQIDFISAHGPSDKHLDQIETQKIKELFKDHAYKIPVNSIKGVTGNPLAAAGPMQILSCALAIQNGILPPTANFKIPDPLCDLDYISAPRTNAIHRALANNHGFGGSNSSMVVEKFK